MAVIHSPALCLIYSPYLTAPLSAYLIALEMAIDGGV